MKITPFQLLLNYKLLIEKILLNSHVLMTQNLFRKLKHLLKLKMGMHLKVRAFSYTKMLEDIKRIIEKGDAYLSGDDRSMQLLFS